MKVGLVTIAYNEERFIGPFIRHIPEWVNETLVLVSTKPWQGPHDPPDKTADIAELTGVSVIRGEWATEHEQRMVGQQYFADYDWIIILDPDEYLSRVGWKSLRAFLLSEDALAANAFVVAQQNTYWKRGYRIAPREDYKQIILVRPSVNFVDKRVVDTGYGAVPVRLHHMSWARTDAEVKSKITHYAHAHELDPTWYERVWRQWTPSMKDLHPLTPPSLRQAVPADLPSDIAKLDLWPPIDEEIENV